MKHCVPFNLSQETQTAGFTTERMWPHLSPKPPCLCWVPWFSCSTASPGTHHPTLPSRQAPGIQDFPFFSGRHFILPGVLGTEASLNGCEQHTTNMQTKCVEGMLTGYLLTGFSFLKPPAACTHTQACPFPILKQHKLNVQLCNFQTQGLFQMWTS